LRVRISQGSSNCGALHADQYTGSNSQKGKSNRYLNKGKATVSASRKAI
jgi:hypothetical protein